MRQFRLQAVGLLILFTNTFLSSCGGGGGGNQKLGGALTANPSTLNMGPGTSLTAQITTSTGSSETVTISGLPNGVTVSPASPFTVGTAGTTVTFNVGSSVPLGSYSIALSSTDATGQITLAVQPLADFSFLINQGQSKNLIAGQSFVGGINSGTTSDGATNYNISLSVSALPPGVSATFDKTTIPVLGDTGVTFQSSANAPATLSATVTATATRTPDGVKRTASFALSVVPVPGTLPNNRTQFVPTNDQVFAAAYDPVHTLIFASLPNLNRVEAISTTTGQIVKSIPVPYPQALSMKPDDSQVLVSTRMQVLCFIDTVSLQVVQRSVLPQYAVPGHTPGFITPNDSLIVSTGDVLVNGNTSGVFDWNPSSNTLTVIPNTNLGGQWIWARSGDGTKVLMSTGQEVPGQLFVFDPTTQNFSANKQFNGVPIELAANPNGTQFVALVLGEADYVFDSNLNIIGTLPVGGSTYGICYSADGSIIYVVTQPYGTGYTPVIYSISATTFQILATAPAYASNILGFFVSPQQYTAEVPFAADDNGTVFGTADHGVVFDDATYNQPAIAPLPYMQFTILAEPAQGPTKAATPTKIVTDAYPSPPDVWFGNQRGTNLGLSVGSPEATAPPASTVGTVVIKVIQPTGEVNYIPQGFTYGAAFLPYATMASAPAGGETAEVFGYGFGYGISQPPPVQLNVGNNSATLVPESSIEDEPYPFPYVRVDFKVPAGTGGPQDLTVTSSSGSATIPGGFHYLTSVADYPSSTPYQSLVYDSTRQQLYMTAATRVDVFSLSSSQFVSPIVPATVHGQSQLMGLVLTPDHSRLLVANYADQSLAILDPDHLVAAKAVALVNPSDGSSVNPVSIAVTSTNKALITTTDPGFPGGYGSALLGVDLSSLQITNESLPGGGMPNLQFPSYNSTDGTKVLISGGLLLDVSSNTWQGAQPLIETSDGALSGDGNTFVGTDLRTSINMFDDQAVLVGQGETPDFFTPLPWIRIGTKVHDTGALAYVPKQNEIDIYDVHNGDVRERILILENPPPLNTSYASSPLAISDDGSQIFLITSTGTSVLKLDSVPMSIGSIVPNTGSAGTPLTIRGSGFVSGTAVSIGGIAASTTFVDTNTLQVIAPAVPKGAAMVGAENPDGSRYSWDAAYTAN